MYNAIFYVLTFFFLFSIFQTMFAKAIYDNIAESPDELAFKRGDLLTVIEQDTDGLEGWWLCTTRNGRQVNMYPNLYPTFILIFWPSRIVILNIPEMGIEFHRVLFLKADVLLTAIVLITKYIVVH